MRLDTVLTKSIKMNSNVIFVGDLKSGDKNLNILVTWPLNIQKEQFILVTQEFLEKTVSLS